MYVVNVEMQCLKVSVWTSVGVVEW